MGNLVHVPSTNCTGENENSNEQVERTLARPSISSRRKVWICSNIGREKEGRISALLTFWKWGRLNATPKTSYLVIFGSLSHNLLPALENTNIVAKGWSKSVLVLDLCLVALRSDHPIWMDSEQIFRGSRYHWISRFSRVISPRFLILFAMVGSYEVLFRSNKVLTLW